jgi:D-glycero-alpha-D-manno-heptose 1-phosphate guanylyltransferase
LKSDLENTVAVLLAGGLGTRLKSVVSDRSKVVATVNGRPFLHFLLDQLAATGIRRVILCTGHLALNVRELIGDNYGPIKLEYSTETEPLGTGGALRLALPLLSSDPVLVMNGDSFCDINLQLFSANHFKSQATASLALVSVDEIKRYGAVNISTNGIVTNFEEKGLRQGKGLINAGIYLLSKENIANIPAGKAVSLERDVFPELIGNGLHGFPFSVKFIDIGIPDDYRAAADFFSNPNFYCEDTP